MSNVLWNRYLNSINMHAPNKFWKVYAWKTFQRSMWCNSRSPWSPSNWTFLIWYDETINISKFNPQLNHFNFVHFHKHKPPILFQVKPQSYTVQIKSLLLFWWLSFHHSSTVLALLLTHHLKFLIMIKKYLNQNLHHHRINQTAEKNQMELRL